MLDDVGDGLLNNVVWAIVQFPKNQWVGEGLGEALVVDSVDHRAVDSKGRSSFVFIVENCLREKLLETYNVLVGDVVSE